MKAALWRSQLRPGRRAAPPRGRASRPETVADCSLRVKGAARGVAVRRPSLRLGVDGLPGITETMARARFVQLFVHNGCVVSARSGSGFDLFALRGRADDVFGTGTPLGKLRRRDVGVPRLVVCRGYGTSRSDS
jgi:hypothetical protein